MHWIEHLYVYGLYPFIRFLGDGISKLIPFPLLLLAVSTIVLVVLYHLLRRIFLGVRLSIGKSIKIILVTAFTLVICFYLLWGLVYSRSSFTELSGIALKESSLLDLKESFTAQSKLLDQMRYSIRSTYCFNLNRDFFDAGNMEKSRQDLFLAFDRVKIKPVGKPTIKAFVPQGFLLHLGTAGFYFPFGFEGYVDKGLHPIQLPFTIAHELSHAAGIPGEGECNFLAWLACSQSDNAFDRYSAAIVYWKYLAGQIRVDDQEYVTHVIENLSEDVRNDLFDIRKYSDRYPDWFPQMRDAIYEWYLKINGIPEGEKSYSSLIGYINRWNELQEIKLSQPAQ
ncbi:MAG: DUF3810 family protein [Saprospiraceae bacterium]